LLPASGPSRRTPPCYPSCESTITYILNKPRCHQAKAASQQPSSVSTHHVSESRICRLTSLIPLRKPCPPPSHRKHRPLRTEKVLHSSHQRYLAAVHLALPQTPTRPTHMIRRECTTLPGPRTSTRLVPFVSPIATWRRPLAILFFPSLRPRRFPGLSQHDDSTSAAPSHPSS